MNALKVNSKHKSELPIEKFSGCITFLVKALNYTVKIFIGLFKLF